MITASFREGINEILPLLANQDNLVIMCSEVVPDIANVQPGDDVAVFGYVANKYES